MEQTELSLRAIIVKLMKSQYALYLAVDALAGDNGEVANLLLEHKQLFDEAVRELEHG